MSSLDSKKNKFMEKLSGILNKFVDKLRVILLSAKSKFKGEILVIVLYLVLTLILLYPFSVLNMNSQLIGDGGDTWQGLWNLWWVKHSALSLANPFVTNYLFYPLGADLYVHSLSPAAGFVTIPFQLTLGVIFSYNLLIILSFVLGGYGAYRLALYVTSDKKASVFSGIVFGFSTYHFARAWGHLNLVSIQWISFYVLFLLKMRKEASFKNVLLAVFFLVLTGLMADLTYVFFLGLFTAFILVYDLLFDRQQIKKFLLRLGIMVVVFLGVMSLIIGPFFIGMLTGKYAYTGALSNDSVLYSADLLSFFTPSSLNLFFGKYASDVASHFSVAGIEGAVYIGYTTLALAVFAAIRLWKEAKFWVLGALAFMILSLGPVLHVYGNSSLPLPEALLGYALPIFRTPSRLILIALLFLAVLSALTLKHINAWFAKLRQGKSVGLLFLVFVSTSLLVEINMVPFPVVKDTSVPAFYGQLASVNGTFSVLDFPQDFGPNNLYMYYSTVSEKPLVGGAISRIAPANLQFLQTFPIIGQMDYIQNGGEASNWSDIILQDPNIANLNSFFFFNVGYVVLHKEMLSHSAFEKMDAYLGGLLGQSVYSDDRIVAFCTNATSLRSAFEFLSSGWWDLGMLDGVATRWMSGNATVTVVSPLSDYYNVSFSAITNIDNVNLEVLLNGEAVEDFQVTTTTFSTISLNGLHFRGGVNELTFFSEQTFVPANTFANSLDTRVLSVLFQNISIIPQVTFP
jgi:hypothetical protein